MLASFAMLISHALISTNSFLLVDALSRRFKTRLITEINGLNYICPKLFLLVLLNILIFLGFPGSIFFISEILFFSFFFPFFSGHSSEKFPGRAPDLPAVPVFWQLRFWSLLFVNENFAGRPLGPRFLVAAEIRKFDLHSGQIWMGFNNHWPRLRYVLSKPPRQIFPPPRQKTAPRGVGVISPPGNFADEWLEKGKKVAKREGDN